MIDFNSTEDFFYEHSGDKYSSVCKELGKTLCKIGYGSYGTVFNLSKTQVLKVYKKCDLAYLSFLRLIMEKQSIHFPEVYQQGNCKKFHFVVLERIDPYLPLWGSEEAHLATLRDRLTGTRNTAHNGPDAIPESLREALGLMAPLAGIFALDVFARNLGTKNNQVVFLDPVCNHTPKQETVFEERLYKFAA